MTVGPLATGPIQAVSFFDVCDGKATITDDMPEVQLHSLPSASHWDRNYPPTVQFMNVYNVTQELVGSCLLSTGFPFNAITSFGCCYVHLGHLNHSRV